jgi:hypothetical protein
VNRGREVVFLSPKYLLHQVAPHTCMSLIYSFYSFRKFFSTNAVGSFPVDGRGWEGGSLVMDCRLMYLVHHHFVQFSVGG